MHRFSVLMVVAAVVIGALVMRSTVDGRAQQRTPAVGGTGVITERLSRGPWELAPEQALVLLRITYVPGGGVAPHTHPGETMFHLASGTLLFTLHEGEAQLVRASNDGPAAATLTAAEAVPVGAEITLAAGDTIFYDGEVLQSERNDGDEDAVILVSKLQGV